MIIGKHPPTENTPGIVGQEYFDDSSDTTYICTDVKHVTSPIPGEHDAKYVWKAGGSGGASSWNDLTDKPFGEVGGDTLTWDGNIEGLETLEVDIGDGLMPVYIRISDSVITKNDLANGIAFTDTVYGDTTIPAEEVQTIYDELGYFGSEFFFFIPTDGWQIDADGIPLEFSKAGVWHINPMFVGGYVSSITIPGYTGFPAVKAIDPKYLPEGYPYKETATIKGEQIDSFTVETVAKNSYGDTITYLAESGHPDYNSDAIPAGNVVINYDGVDYKTSRIVNNFGGMIYAHGNLSLYFPSLQDTGEPFCWFYFGGSCKLATATPGVHTVVVRAEDGQGTIIHPLAAEFLTFPIIYTEHNGRPTGLNMSYNEFRHALEMGFSAVKSISPDEYEQYREIRTMTFCRIDNDGSISIWFNEESSPVEIDSAGNFMDAPM